jgi:1,4-dihydroxy-2-naphthoate octaprenyltransferase
MGDLADSRAVAVAGGEGRAGITVWLQTARIKSLAISSIAVFTGGAVALYDGYISWRLLIAWLGSVLIQAGTNLINVSFNYKAGIATPGFSADPRGSSAPVRMGLLTPEQVRRGALVCFGLGMGCGLVLAWLCGWQILAVGLPAVAAGYSYGAPPLRTAYRGAGVITVLLFMGPAMVLGSYFVVTLHLAAGAAWASLAIGLLAAAIMHTNDLRDYAGDVAHGKRTLATLLGREPASHALLAMVLIAWLAIGLAVVTHTLPWPVLVTLVTLPRALALVRMVYVERDAARLNAAWFRGVQLHSEFGVLLIAGLLAAAAFGF